jgi:hypothetical protein
MAKKQAQEAITKTTVRCPASLWKRVRMRAIQDGTSAESLVIAALTAYLKGGK